MVNQRAENKYLWGTKLLIGYQDRYPYSHKALEPIKKRGQKVAKSQESEMTRGTQLSSRHDRTRILWLPTHDNFE